MTFSVSKMKIANTRQSNTRHKKFILVRTSSPQESYVQTLSNTSGFHYPRVQSPLRTLTHLAAAGLLFTTRRGITTPWKPPGLPSTRRETNTLETPRSSFNTKGTNTLETPRSSFNTKGTNTKKCSGRQAPRSSLKTNARSEATTER
ncbi:hypothetical protein Taro_041297 [Colocasia esculenta]|uniref:Uncharacterized protein n=1 Tax=Colocasia esculenta TaxID=4460 RepID=A0A843WE11_COLES|nr:hypothetical protein [Colocasia esculenta]